MSKWQILLIKELRHLFRDTKTIIQTVVVPTFITPLLIGGIFYYIGSLAVEEGKKLMILGLLEKQIMLFSRAWKNLNDSI